MKHILYSVLIIIAKALGVGILVAAGVVVLACALYMAIGKGEDWEGKEELDGPPPNVWGTTFPERKEDKSLNGTSESK